MVRMNMRIRSSLFCLAASALAGCASVGTQPGSFVGRPIAEAVRELGPPSSVQDYQDKGRYFGWGLSDLRFDDARADNPAHWLDPITRTNAPETLDEAKLVSLPDYIVSPPFRASPCTLTLVADWDERAKKWVARRQIRKGASAGGHCGPRSPHE